MTIKSEQDIRSKIKAAMQGAGFTQQGLADELGIKHPTVNSWVTGKRNPTVTTLKKIAQATGKPLSFFFDSSITSNSHNIAGHDNNIAISSDVESLKKDMLLVKKEIEILKLKLEISCKKTK